MPLSHKAERDLVKLTRNIRRDLLPKMQSSAFCITIGSDTPDAKLCIEVGAMVLLDKPVIVALPKGVKISNNLKRCATAIVELTGDNAKDQANLAAAMDNVLANDVRTRN